MYSWNKAIKAAILHRFNLAPMDTVGLQNNAKRNKLLWKYVELKCVAGNANLNGFYMEISSIA